MSDDIVREFLVESNENLDLLDRELITLERDPGNRETLSSIFRTIHTIKGTCGFLAFPKLESVAHAGENFLSQLRDGVLVLSPESATALLRMVDAIRQMLHSIETSGNEGERDDSAVIEALRRLQKGESEAQRKSAQEPHAEKPASQGKENETPSAKQQQAEGQLGQAVKLLGNILVEQGMATPEEVAGAIQKQLEGDTRSLGEILIDRGVVKSQDVVAAVQVQQAAKSAARETSIRVDVTRLDNLMNLVGELVLARNQIVQFANITQNTGLVASSQRLNLISTELQEEVMKTRMQPIGNIWSRFPRMARDLAMSCGKQVRIEMEGKEIELDKTIIEAIKDPLTHLVRNALDHGIETPQKRIAAGKSAEGLLRLRAYHEGGQVNIELTDDGAGLDEGQIRKRAVQRRLITLQHAAHMTEREVANLIFLPGFSTAEAVTTVSGRGVGLDVVKTNIERIGGTVDLQTETGGGTTVKMKIPLTLAIIPALLITSGSARFAIPKVSLIELVRIAAENVRKSIEKVQGAPVYRLRGQLLPLVYLNKELQLERGEPPAQAAKSQAAARSEPEINIIVLQAEGEPFGLVVDQVNDTEEIVVKPLGRQLKSVGVFAGATILGDGELALILNVRGLAQRAGLIGGERKVRHRDSGCEVAEEPAGNTKNALLIFQSGSGGRMAIELSLVARLEEIARENVEKAGEREVVQYRGQILPLIHVSDVLENGNKQQHAASLDDPLQVVVCREEGCAFGLVVDKVLDIAEEAVLLEQPAKRAGVRGTAVIQRKVTDLLDLKELVRLAALAGARER
ncbi:MAG TPA: chemotaxis protein CheA [Candidatus Dormibacteraeota bacterium]|nr:chemotaxis protein CheA [Candidatus Dormibacteraeota bacterium]